MLKKKKTTASGKLVLVKSVRRTRSHRMKFCVQRGLGALPSTSKRRGKSRRDFALCGSVCINTGIAHRLNSFQISRIVLLVLLRSPAYGARGFHAFLTDSCNKASSSEWLPHLLEKHLD